MKKLIIIIYIILFASLTQAQWQWANHIGSSFNQYSERGWIFTDGSNIYLAGSYSGNLDLGFVTINAAGANDMMLVKYDANGNGVWAKNFGGSGNIPNEWEDASAVFDPVGSCIYIAGNFYNAMTLGGSCTLSSAGGSDIFLAKMDLNGNCIWAKRAGGIADDQARAYISPAGLIYLVAETKDSANFDSIRLPQGGCIARYDTSGNCLWVANKYNSVDSNLIKLSFIDNDVILYGGYRSSIFILDTTSIQNSGSLDFFIARADSNANIKWIKHYGEIGFDNLNNLAIDGNNNIYGLISFQNSISIDGNNLNSVGTGDMVLLKYDANGNLTFHKQISSSGYIYPINTNCDNAGNIYVAGFMTGTVSFDSYIINSGIPYECFLTRFDENGNVMGIRNFTNAQPSSIDVDNSGNVICGGGFQNTVTIGLNTFNSLGSYDIFITKTGAITGIGGNGRAASNQLIIYANPNKGIFNIKVPDEIKTINGAMLIVFDNVGHETARFALDDKDDVPHFNVNNAASGLYTVKLIQGDKVYSGKLVVE